MISTTPLTVCMFSNLYPPVYSGSSTQCSQLAKELAKLNFNVVVITSRIDMASKEFEVVDGVCVYRLPCIRLPRMPIALNFPWLNITYTFRNNQRIGEILRKHPPDIIHLHNHMFDLALHAVHMAGRLNKPLIVSMHTIIKHPTFIYNIILTLVDRVLLKHLVVRKAKILICPDQIIVDYAMRTFGNVRTKLIPYGINELPDPDLSNSLRIRNRYKIGPGPVIISLGHLHEIRNRKELILITPELVGRFPNIKIMIVGDVGTRSAEILAEKLKVSDYIIFTGAVPHYEIQDYLALGDIEAHWFDKKHPHKSLGIAAQEAMSAGKVVIGNAEENLYGRGILENGANVILVDPSESQTLICKIIDLLEDDLKRSFIGKNARNLTRKHFSWYVICKQIVAVYSEFQSG